MNEPNSIDLLDKLCTQFDDAWQSLREGTATGKSPPSIESFLDQVGSDKHADLIEQLVQIELHYRQSQNPPPGEKEFLTRFPDHQDAVRIAFGAFAVGDESGGLAKPIAGNDDSIYRQAGELAADELNEHSVDTTNEPSEFGLGSTIDQSMYRPDDVPESASLPSASRPRPRARSRRRVDEDPSRPDYIDKFRIRRTLGKGAFGVVYLAAR